MKSERRRSPRLSLSVKIMPVLPFGSSVFYWNRFDSTRPRSRSRPSLLICLNR